MQRTVAKQTEILFAHGKIIHSSDLIHPGPENETFVLRGSVVNINLNESERGEREFEFKNICLPVAKSWNGQRYCEDGSDEAVVVIYTTTTAPPDSLVVFPLVAISLSVVARSFWWCSRKLQQSSAKRDIPPGCVDKIRMERAANAQTECGNCSGNYSY